MSDIIKNKYDFMLLFDVENGNPNGDPDADNMPRQHDNGIGYVTNGCLNRKARDYVEMVKEDAEKFKIFIKNNAILNELAAEGFAAKGTSIGSAAKAKKSDPDIDIKIKDWLCENYYDIRTFGAAMTTFKKAGINYGEIKGPVHFNTVCDSVEPITIEEVSINRIAVNNRDDAKKTDHTGGHYYIVPYALYCCKGYVSLKDARKPYGTGFTEEDLELFWEAAMNMFEIDRSARKGLLSFKKLIIFKHESRFGNAHADKLFDLVNISRKDKDAITQARKYSDYVIDINEAALPEGIELIVKE